MWDTQITWLIPARENFSTLLVIIELASAKPNREWSVKTALICMVRAWNMASCAKVENACNTEKTYKHHIAAIN